MHMWTQTSLSGITISTVEQMLLVDAASCTYHPPRMALAFAGWHCHAQALCPYSMSGAADSCWDKVQKLGLDFRPDNLCPGATWPCGCWQCPCPSPFDTEVSQVPEILLLCIPSHAGRGKACAAPAQQSVTSTAANTCEAGIRKHVEAFKIMTCSHVSTCFQ